MRHLRHKTNLKYDITLHLHLHYTETGPVINKSLSAVIHKKSVFP